MKSYYVPEIFGQQQSWPPSGVSFYKAVCPWDSSSTWLLWLLHSSLWSRNIISLTLLCSIMCIKTFRKGCVLPGGAEKSSSLTFLTCVLLWDVNAEISIPWSIESGNFEVSYIDFFTSQSLSYVNENICEANTRCSVSQFYRISFLWSFPWDGILWEHILGNAAEVSPVGTGYYVWSSF